MIEAGGDTKVAERHHPAADQKLDLGPNLNDRLELINSTPVEVDVEQRSPRLRLITAKLPEGSFWSYLSENSRGDTTAKVGWVRVPEELRGHGIGERLTRGLMSASMTLGATSMEGDVRNEASLVILQRVAGEDNLSFYSLENDGPEDQPLSAEQAMAALRAASEHEQNPDEREFGVGMRIDLNKVDTSDWDQPIINGDQA